VLLPLRPPFLGYFEKIIKPAALEAGLTALKADDIYGTREVIKDIWDLIWKARAVVAIVTDRNPNVNYELGICHSLNVPTVLITEREEDVPFDYRHRRYIQYHTREADWQQKLTEDLTKTLKTVLSSPALDNDLPWPYDTFELNVSGRIGSLLSAGKARSSVVKGVDLVSCAVAPAFGPEGSQVSVTIPRLGRQIAYRRGARIAEGIRSGYPLESQGIEQAQRLSHEVLNAVGDCSKTAVFLCAEMLRAGDAALQSGHKPRYLISGMRRAVEAATAYIMTQAKAVTGDQLHAIALAACGGDETVSAAVVEALRRVGSDGVVQVIDGTGANPALEFQEGMSFDRGLLSPFFVTDIERQECVLEDSYVLIYDGKIGSMRDLLPLLEQLARAGKPFLVIAEDVVQEALATLVVNKQRGTIACAAVRAPGFGDNRTALLQDVAVLTGGRAFLSEVMRPLSEIKLLDLGRAKKVIISKDTTTLIGGSGSPREVASRIKQLKNEMSQTRSDFEIDRLRERLAKLAGGIAVLRSAGRTADDLADSRYKLESAMHSCSSAIENGYVVGGGVCYCRAKSQVDKLVPKNATEKLGIDAVSGALVSPLRQLLENSQHPDPSDIINQVVQGSNNMTGFNVESGHVEDLSNAHVFDSAKALQQALATSLAYAEGILKTAAWDTAPSPELKNHDESGS